ncbi:hypothetical protein HYH02_010046 [Chlamydomonas schloesseri]|uniref:Uncharacterized protein n=1 Tax=Chlamydomonas schloesseri TaxID=2026947 RepID=A0A835T966_9CHLO|nr:hypothetical protein HYH02_010046 [Chlamydomonas schloesseri]|eukprot:KAG2441202.1 hypothetical protein HYH02_010046 [Chlamydomonas schloesseri]
MPRFELSDRNLIDLSSAAHLALGAHALAAPDNFMDVNFGPKLTHPGRVLAPPELTRWTGATLVTLGAMGLAARNGLTPEGKRRWFQTGGVATAACAALSAADTLRGRKRKSVGWSHAGTFAVIAALKLWRGFKRNNTRVKADL